METYKIITSVFGRKTFVRMSDLASIPEDPDNRDYQKYLRDLAEFGADQIIEADVQ